LFENGIFTISLDFELYWGVRDIYTLNEYKRYLSGVPNAIDLILQEFEKYNIHASWAVVGFLFFKNRDELLTHIPYTTPHYKNRDLNPYIYIKEKKLEEKFHFAPNIIKKISNTPNQEIATHTFSHYYSLEDGQNIKAFEVDLKKAIEIEKKYISKEPKSLVFPRNQWNEDYLKVLKKLNIHSYRGNEKSWFYRVENGDSIKNIRRAFKLIDTYINISGSNSYSFNELKKAYPFNIASSKFLRPYSEKLSMFEPLKLRRIKQSMLYAAKRKRLYHLWWHPHNFGINTQKNIEMLQNILEYYDYLNREYQMQSLNMEEVSKLLMNNFSKN